MKQYQNTITMSFVGILALSLNASAGEVFLPTITVKGELQERNVQDSQTSAVVFSGEKLDESTDSNLYDVIKRTAGITTVSGDKGFSIRGISTGNTINITLDGMTIPTRTNAQFGPYSTWDLEQIEILRGAQSTQSGRNSLAGAINIRTANPTFDQESKMRFDIGSRDSMTIALAHNQPLIDDMLAVRIAGEFLKTDGWVTNPTLDDDKYDAREMNTGRIKLLYKPIENLTAVLGYSATNNSGGEDSVDYDTWSEHRYNRSDVKAQEGTTSRVTTLDLDYKINDNWSIKSLTGHFDADSTRREDFDMSAVRGGYLNREGEATTLTQELKVAYVSSNIRSVFGLFYTRIDNDTNPDTKDVPGGSLDPTLDPFQMRADILSDAKVKTENKAIFGEIEYDFNAYWTLVVGARYDMESVDFKFDTVGKVTDQGFLPPALVPVLEDRITSSVEHNTDYSAFLPKIGLVYHFDEHKSLGLNYQKGYRAGGSGRNLYSRESYSYDPEYTDTVELAWRLKSANNKTTFNANLFYTKWENMQVVVQEPGNIHNNYIDNSGSSTLYGAEFTTSHYLRDDLNVFVSAAYVKTEYDEYITQGQDYSGNEFSFAPELTVSIGGVYYFLENWLVSADVNYQSESYGNPTNSDAEKIEAYALLNAKFGYEEEHWSAFIYGRNLTDKTYATQYFTDDAGARDRVRTGEPLFVGLQVNVRF